MKHELVLVVDFGGQYNQLIARRVRENNVYCEIIPYTTDIEKIKSMNPKGIIFTGGPNSAYLEDSPKIAKEIFEIGVPILGICYGIQVMSHILGGNVRKGTNAEKEYGKTEITYKESAIFEGISTNIVWMSHTDLIDKLPEGFKSIAHTKDCPVAAMENTEKKLSEEESASVGQDEPEIPYLQNRLPEPQEITLIGEAVTMGSLAAAIEKKYHKAVRVICPLETNAGLLALNDRVAKGEEEVQELLKDARIIIADPLYRPICPKSSSFYELPHIAFSGRIFLRGIKEGKYLSEI